MRIEVYGKCVSGKHHDVKYHLDGDGETGYLMNGKNPLWHCKDKIHEINWCLLRDHTDLAYIKPGEVRFLASENYWVKIEAKD